MIISMLILVFVAASAWEFSVAFCRTLLLTYSKVELSATVCELIGARAGAPGAADFNRVLTMVRLAPDPGDDRMEITAVRLYHGLLRTAELLASPLSARISRWFDAELSRCSYFAAVTLDRRLAAAPE